MALSWSTHSTSHDAALAEPRCQQHDFLFTRGERASERRKGPPYPHLKIHNLCARVASDTKTTSACPGPGHDGFRHCRKSAAGLRAHRSWNVAVPVMKMIGAGCPEPSRRWPEDRDRWRQGNRNNKAARHCRRDITLQEFAGEKRTTGEAEFTDLNELQSSATSLWSVTNTHNERSSNRLRSLEW